MIQVRSRNERGHANHGWLDTFHTFSFSSYYDPEFMGFRALRVINEDRVAPGMGFGTHPHRDMEIITYILEGALQHKDSLGTGSIIRPGDVQRMSAGTGVTHSEFNASKTEPVHFLQIWIMPEQEGIKPSYEQAAVARTDLQGKLKLLASRNADSGSVLIYQDMKLLVAVLNPGESVTYSLPVERYAWLQVARGGVRLNSHELRAGDGAAVTKETALEIVGKEENSEILLFDLA